MKIKILGLFTVKIEPTKIDDVKIIWPDKFGDHRGFFLKLSTLINSSGMA